MISAFGSTLLTAGAAAQQQSFNEQLVGTWTLVTCDVIEPDGTKTPLVEGDDPTGQMIFTSTVTR
jgi:hypothetical protein